MASVSGGLFEDVMEVFPQAPIKPPILCCLTLQSMEGDSMSFEKMDEALDKYLMLDKALTTALGTNVWYNSIDPKTYVTSKNILLACCI